VEILAADAGNISPSAVQCFDRNGFLYLDQLIYILKISFTIFFTKKIP
jgi:hypothetical protein